MKHSIRVKFTMIFTSLMAVALITLWAVNSFFLEGFYTSQKVKVLERAYQKLNQYVMEKREAGESVSSGLEGLFSEEGEQNDITRLIRILKEKYNVTLTIVDSVDDDVIIPNYWDSRFLSEQLHQYILGITRTDTETLREE